VNEGEEPTLLGDRDESYMSLPLEFYDSESMRWQLAGELKRVEDGGEQRLEVHDPIKWPGYNPNIPLDGSTCRPGRCVAASFIFKRTPPKHNARDERCQFSFPINLIIIYNCNHKRFKTVDVR
jgi:hypothetical protein